MKIAAVVLVVSACASPKAPSPAPAPGPSAPVSRPSSSPPSSAPATNTPASATRAADSVRIARAKRDSAVVPPKAPTRRAASRPRSVLPSARNDTLATAELAAPVRVCAGGDVTLGTNLDREWSRVAAKKMTTVYQRSDAPDSLIAPLRPLLDGADVVLLNVESAIGSGASPSKCGKKSTNCYAFRAPVAAAYALRDVARQQKVVGNVANNHSRDAGPEGQDTTIALLTRAGVLVTGYDTIATPVPTPAGDTIGVLGFYTSIESPDARDTAAVFRHVARAAARYPVVIATMHLGAEGIGAQRTRNATEIFLKIDRGNPVAFADAAVRGGAALVVGHGPHVLRALEWRDRGALIAYSLGNLITYGPFTLKEPLNRGGVLCATIDMSGRVSEASLASTMQLAPGVMQADSKHRAAALVDSLGLLDFRLTGARAGPDGVLKARP